MLKNYLLKIYLKIISKSWNTMSVIEDIENHILDEDNKRSSSQSLQFEESNNERRWRLSYLKEQFETFELRKLFDRYIQRISHGYFSQFLSLQIILVTAHFITLISAAEVNHPDEAHIIVPDLILYGLVMLLSIILLVITDTYVKKYPVLLKYLAGTAFIIIFFINAFIPFYYKNEHLRPAYSTYLIISNYIFLNVHDDLVAFVLGLFVSIFHLIILILVTYDDTGRLYERLGSDAIFLASINGLGLYFRYMNEIVIRRSFLDRRSCIESTHQLRFEEEQENNLMSSIIPQHIISKVRKNLKDYIGHYGKNSRLPTQKPFEDLYVEDHPNVTILFADIVNYTAMTTKLSVTDLLDVLNELFGRFDDASDELQVLRIKFLGDCYYCVAGLPPNPAPNHAQACVDLGLKMISIIADIRDRKDLDINMRIGIHSGKISSGIIGTIKWQYDIWSRDVDTANKMETEGTPGMVHITRETKEKLRKSYDIRLSGKTVNGEKTYLIAPSTEKQANGVNKVEKVDKPESNTEENGENQRRPTIYIKRTSTAPNDLRSSNTVAQNSRNYSRDNSFYKTGYENGSIKIKSDRRKQTPLEKRHTFPTSNDRRISGSLGLVLSRSGSSGNVRISTERRLTGNDRKRRTAFMNNNIKRYNERLEETNKELEGTIESMLLSKFEQWFKVNDMYQILLIFKDWKNEKGFIETPDPLFKYYLLCEIFLLVLLFIVENLTLSKWGWPSWPYYATFGAIVFIFLPLSWTHYIWTKYFAKFENDLPTNKIILLLYSSSKMITRNWIFRLIIYIIVYTLFCACVVLEWQDCFNIIDAETFAQNLSNSSLALITNNDLRHTTQCAIPWHMTETCGLAIITSFMFLRMYMWIKLFGATVIGGIYFYFILEYSGSFYGDSHTFNYLLSPQISHIMSICFLSLILHLVDRQTEYMNRIDHIWYRSLIEKEKQASEVQRLNNILLQNILPVHVADLYLNLSRNFSDEVFNEFYEDAAVVFASITNFSIEEMGQGFLKIMSAIISEFDLLLVGNSFGRPIEKIKIAKWTYMAACGLAPGLGNTDNIRKDSRSHVVISLLKFATSLMQKLKAMNKEIGQEMKLRIGISHGFVAAGVVGSKKPLYDIWGDPVNMASRMDTTGHPDCIQVLKPTAEIIETFGYSCRPRGLIRVKGREGLVSTYFVDLDDDFNLIKRNNKA